MKTLLVVAVAGGTFSANADVLRGELNPLNLRFEAASANLSPNTAARTTDGYFLAPGIGSAASGFGLAGSNIVDSTFDGAAEAIGTSINGGILAGFDGTLSGDVSAIGNSVIQISVFDNDNADLQPAGVTLGGVPADQSGLFLGANAGGNPLDFSNPAFVNEALYFGLDAAGVPVFVIDVTATLNNFNLNPDGSWDGSLGIVLNAPSVGLGVVETGFQFDIDIVPAPSTAALLGLGGLAAARRRR
ncbi:MAG: PEP-CTERM sorting domain-containing protein [Planctomycetota bacterium]